MSEPNKIIIEESFEIKICKIFSSLLLDYKIHKGLIETRPGHIIEVFIPNDRSDEGSIMNFFITRRYEKPRKWIGSIYAFNKQEWTFNLRGREYLKKAEELVKVLISTFDVPMIKVVIVSEKPDHERVIPDYPVDVPGF